MSDQVTFALEAEANKSIITALIAARGEITSLAKDEQMKGSGGYFYASEKGYKELIVPKLLEHGLWLVGPRVTHQSVRQEQSRGGEVIYKGYVVVEYDLCHISGAIWPRPISAAGEGSDALDKAINKAHTSANKNMLDKLFQIPTEKEESGQQQNAAPPPARASAQPPAGGAQVMAPPAQSGAAPPPATQGGQSAPTNPNAIFQPNQTTGDEYVWLEVLSGKYFPPKGNQIDGSVSWQMKDPENGAVAYVSMKWSLAGEWLKLDDPTSIRGKYLCQVRSRVWNDKVFWDCDAIMSPTRAAEVSGGPVPGAQGEGDFDGGPGLAPPIPADDPRYNPAGTPGD